MQFRCPNVPNNFINSQSTHVDRKSNLKTRRSAYSRHRPFVGSAYQSDFQRVTALLHLDFTGAHTGPQVAQVLHSPKSESG